MQAVEGIYRNGHIKLLETPPEIHQARVIVTFLDEDRNITGHRQSVLNLGEILDDDLESASRSIAETFNQALAQSAPELEN